MNISLLGANVTNGARGQLYQQFTRGFFMWSAGFSCEWQKKPFHKTFLYEIHMKFLLCAKKALKNLLSTLRFLPFAFNQSLKLTPGVNFTNILWAAFAPKSFCQKITNPNCKHMKGAKRTWVWKSCLQNIGEIDSHTKVICTAFKCLQFGFVNFWQKDFGTKAAHKMLVKLKPGHSTSQ